VQQHHCIAGVLECVQHTCPCAQTLAALLCTREASCTALSTLTDLARKCWLARDTSLTPAISLRRSWLRCARCCRRHWAACRPPCCAPSSRPRPPSCARSSGSTRSRHGTLPPDLAGLPNQGVSWRGPLFTAGRPATAWSRPCRVRHPLARPKPLGGRGQAPELGLRQHVSASKILQKCWAVAGAAHVNKHADAA